MPLSTETYGLAEEADRLRETIEALGDEASKYDTETPHFEQAEAEAARLNMHRQGIEWALADWDADTVELGALTAGEYGQMERYVTDDTTQQARRNVFVAVATVEAPYVGEEIETTITTLADTVHPYFTRWAEDKANTLLRGSGNGNPFYESLRETSTPESPPPETTSNT